MPRQMLLQNLPGLLNLGWVLLFLLLTHRALTVPNWSTSLESILYITVITIVIRPVWNSSTKLE